MGSTTTLRATYDVAEFASHARAAFAGRAVPAFEIGAAAAVRSGTAPAAGTIMAVHGGAWSLVGESALRSMDQEVARWQARGFITVNVDYRAGADSLVDALAFHDAIHGWRGTTEQLGIIGTSAGGHLGLMTAAQRPGVAFVVGQAAPTDLAALGGTAESGDVRRLAQEAFGASDALLGAASPVSRADAIRAHVLLGTSTWDRHVPAMQMDAFAAARPERTETLLLRGGDEPFVHAGIARGETERFAAAEDALVARVSSRLTR